MLDIERLIADCQTAVATGGGEKHVHDILARAVEASKEAWAEHIQNMPNAQ